MKLENFKQKITKYDFLLILALGLIISLSSGYYNFFGFKSRFGAYFFSSTIFCLSCLFSYLRFRFVYGSESYKKEIMEHQKRMSLMTSVPSKNIMLGVIWSGSLASMMINVYQEKYFHFFGFLIFAILASFFLTKLIDAKKKRETKLGIESKNVKFAFNVTSIVLMLILTLFFLIGAFAFLSAKQYAGSFSFLLISIMCFSVVLHNSRK